MMLRSLSSLAALPLLLSLAACGGEAPPALQAPDGHEETPEAPTNRIDVPPAVRRNLGITFATVGTRNVRGTRRVPGRFEFAPEAHRAYHASLPGRVELRVKHLQAIAPGDSLFVVRSAQWTAMQEAFAKTVAGIRLLRSRLAALAGRDQAVARHQERVHEQQAFWKTRIAELERLGKAGGGVGTALADAQAQFVALQTADAKVHEELAELRAERARLQAELVAAKARAPALWQEAHDTGPDTSAREAAAARDFGIQRAARLLGVAPRWLMAAGPDTPGVSRWRTLDTLEVRATDAGVVKALHVTQGGWVEAGAAVLDTVAPSRVRFRAQALQADIAQFRDGMAARVLPPAGDAVAAGATLRTTLALGLEAHPVTRKVDLLATPHADATLPPWARAGVASQLEVILRDVGEPELAIPLASVIQDGLETVYFRRDPKNKDKVIREVADLGARDGSWVVVESGLVEGDEVVHHGVYELMLASGGAKQSGGHFHADGTWHEGDH